MALLLAGGGVQRGGAVAGGEPVAVGEPADVVTARNVSFNGTIAPGASVASFGYQVSRPNGNTQVPTGYTCTSS